MCVLPVIPHPSVTCVVISRPLLAVLKLENEPKALMTKTQWEQVRKWQLRYCVFTVEKNWMCWLEYPKEQREEHRRDLLEMSQFVKKNVPHFGEKTWELPLRICAFLVRYPNRVSLFLACGINVLTRGRKKVLY